MYPAFNFPRLPDDVSKTIAPNGIGELSIVVVKETIHATKVNTAKIVAIIVGIQGERTIFLANDYAVAPAGSSWNATNDVTAGCHQRLVRPWFVGRSRRVWIEDMCIMCHRNPSRR